MQAIIPQKGSFVEFSEVLQKLLHSMMREVTLPRVGVTSAFRARKTQ
jgi:hypothetical protein